MRKEPTCTLTGGEPTATHDNRNRKYNIGKFSKFYSIMNFDLVPMCDTNFCKKRARPP